MSLVVMRPLVLNQGEVTAQPWVATTTERSKRDHADACRAATYAGYAIRQTAGRNSRRYTHRQRGSKSNNTGREGVGVCLMA